MYIFRLCDGERVLQLIPTIILFHLLRLRPSTLTLQICKVINVLQAMVTNCDILSCLACLFFHWPIILVSSAPTREWDKMAMSSLHANRVSCLWCKYGFYLLSARNEGHEGQLVCLQSRAYCGWISQAVSICACKVERVREAFVIWTSFANTNIQSTN